MIFDQPYLVILCALALTIVVEGIAILIIKRKKEYLRIYRKLYHRECK